MRASAALLLLFLPTPVHAQLACGNASIEARTLRYCSGGNGPATVVFESGFSGGAGTWDSVAPRVATFARVITYDRAGHGGSMAAAGPRTPASIATDLLRLLDRIGEREPVVLVGHAGGAWFVREFAQRYRDRVRAIVLLDPPHEEFDARAVATLTPEERARRDTALGAEAAGLVEAARHEQTAIRLTPSSDWSGSLPDVPLLILGAGRHDFVPAERASQLEGVWSELATALAARTRSGRFQLLASAGPDLPQTHPDAVLGAIREVIAGSEPKAAEGISSNVVIGILSILATLLGILVTYRISKPGATFNEMQIARERAQAAREPEQERHPDQLDAWNLIGPDAPVAGRAVKLVQAANAMAAQVYRARMTGAAREHAAEAMWALTWLDPDWEAQRAWIEPYDTGPGSAESLVRDVLVLLRGDEPRIWVTAPAGSGKSTFMNRLFFEAIGVAGTGAMAGRNGAESLAVPMFLQPRNVGAQQRETLRTAPDGFSLFLEAWLRNRAVAIPPESKDALIADFSRSLERGDIALFIDGFDELVDMGLAPFLRDLLGRTRYWVCAERSDRRLSRSGRSVELPPTWTPEQIRDHLDVRWQNRPAWSRKVSEHLRKATDGDEDHILRVPRYLDLFLRRLEEKPALPDESELGELSRGGPELAADIVALALERLPAAPDVSEHELNARLFRVAAARVLQADLVLPRQDRDATWERILQMTEFVSHVVTPDGHNIRITHPALVDYFLAGQIATELRTGAPVLTQGDRHWSRGLRAGVSAWLRRSADPTIHRTIWQRIAAAGEDAPVTNLLELVIQLGLDGPRNARRDVSERDRRREITVADKDLAGRNLEGAELRLVTFSRCRLTQANLGEADLQHTTFHDCDFSGANLAGANALGAEFARCRFLDTANPALLPRVERLQIEAAEFHEGTDAASDVGPSWLTRYGAVQTRTRYGGEFGRIFFSRQAAFLGQVAESLEKGAYRERITAALARCEANRPITVVDLMAGGGNEWLAGLVTPADGGVPRFPGLRVLGIDRDEPQLRELKRKFPEVFKWHQLEIATGGIDLPAIVGEVFGGPGQRMEADLIVARKAIHELRRPIQAPLIAQCFAGLRDGGEFVLFADSPGPVDPVPQAIPDPELRHIDQDIRSLLLDPDVPLGRIRSAITSGVAFGGSTVDQARFCNLWVMVKDWANDNLHEVRNRWFSSAGEIRWWALEAGFAESAPPTAARYRIAVARFNERGIQRVVHHLERNGPGVIATDGAMLGDWLSAHDDERQTLLQEFTAHHLPAGSELQRALDARQVPVDWGLIHEDLRKLSGGGRETLSFEFPVHVMALRKKS